MSLPPALERITGDLGLELLLVLFMLGCSLFLVALAIERLFLLARVRSSLKEARRVVLVARASGLDAAVKAAQGLSGPVAPVFSAGLERAVGRVRGQPVRAMMRECKRVGGAMRARTWLLGTAGALMPFVGLFGTVIGVMSAFAAIGESGQGGFAIVSVGISQALIATAVGIAVALEGVVLFNLLQSIGQHLARELSMLVDELVELIELGGGSHAGSSTE